MRILALETSTKSGSVAVAEGTTFPLEIPLAADQRSARSLAPTIRQALAEVGWKPRDVELLVVTTGPGSFTGLRVGVVTAKAFAYAVGCPLVGVDTLGVVALQALPGDGRPVEAIIDAQRNDLFTSRWLYGNYREPESLTCVRGTRLMTTDEWLATLGPGDTVNGPGLEKVAERLPAEVAIAPRDKWQPTATTTWQLGQWLWQYRRQSCISDPFTLAPQYFRRTAAEEQWDKRHGNANAH